MTGKKFKNSLIEFDKAKKELHEQKMDFIFDVKRYMLKNGIHVRVLFFGDTFGLDIILGNNLSETPQKIPLSVLSNFCDRYGCEFEYTNCDGKRYIFSFDGISMGY